MESFPQKRAGLPVAQVVIALAVVAILAVIVWPASSYPRCGPSRVLSNARQVHQATYRMVLDGVAAEPSPGWPGDLAAAETNPVTTNSQFVEYLVAHKYLDRGSLKNLFSVRDVPLYPGTGPFEAKYSVFQFFKVTSTDPDKTIFLSTRNFRFGAALDATKPYGNAGSVIVYKGGDARSLSSVESMNESVGVMPGGTVENPGEQAGNILKDE